MAKGPIWGEKEIKLLLALKLRTDFSPAEIAQILNDVFGNDRSDAAVYMQLYILEKRMEEEGWNERRKEVLNKLVATDEDETMVLIDDTISDMIQDNTIGEGDMEAVRTVLTWMSLGRAKALEINEEYVKNLEENGFIKDGMIVKGEEDDFATWFVLAIAGAQGYIVQCDVEEE